MKLIHSSYSYAMFPEMEPFSSTPFVMFSFGYALRRSRYALEILLPPLVANNTMSTPVSLFCSRKLRMMWGAVYHQMGKPM